MFLAFSNSLEKQLQWMTRFIDNNANCLAGLRENDLVKFASCYNGAYCPLNSILIAIAVVLKNLCCLRVSSVASFLLFWFWVSNEEDDFFYFHDSVIDQNLYRYDLRNPSTLKRTAQMHTHKLSILIMFFCFCNSRVLSPITSYSMHMFCL